VQQSSTIRKLQTADSAVAAMALPLLHLGHQQTRKKNIAAATVQLM
jgi:hypothetical protein